MRRGHSIAIAGRNRDAALRKPQNEKTSKQQEAQGSVVAWMLSLIIELIQRVRRSVCCFKTHISVQAVYFQVNSGALRPLVQLFSKISSAFLTMSLRELMNWKYSLRSQIS